MSVVFHRLERTGCLIPATSHVPMDGRRRADFALGTTTTHRASWEHRIHPVKFLKLMATSGASIIVGRHD